ncbi:retrovirus-related pol polyprotein from transposon TNT 1-94 [Tanacetum coccineum]|uniref:Retrovirus-related pol polyprotein from transposon TNT 1-94 n=1 Tax=Tanacetum coccineum TaxID=301880 RepID=A0ABQ5EFV2_9ASTR
MKTPVAKTNKFSCNSTGVESSSSVRRPESKDISSMKRVLLNTKSKSTSKEDKKSHSSVNFVSNKNDTINSNVSESKANSKKSLIHFPVAVESSKIGASPVVAKSRFSVATPSKATNKVIQIILWIVDSRFSKNMTGNLKLQRNCVEKFMGTVHFGNDNFAAITRYGDYVQGNLTICHVYYVEGLGHNIFSVGQFYDGDLEIAFCSNTCYVRNLEGVFLLTSSRDSNLYTISIFEMAASSPVCLLSKATSKNPRFKYQKDHLCSSCEQGKSKKATFPPKLISSITSKLELLHTDLCGPMRVEIVNGKRYIMVIVDDYSRYTSTKYEGIMLQTSIAQTPQQNGVVEHKNRTLFEAPRMMLIFSKLPEFLWAEAISTACFAQNRSLVHTSSLCYPTNDRDDLGKMNPKADIEPIAQEPTTPVFDNNSYEQVQKDVEELDGNTFMNLVATLEFKEAESSSNYQEPSNMHEFHQQHRFTDRWTNKQPIEQVIGEPSKHVTIRSRLHTDA